MAERLTGSHEGAKERMPRHRLRTLLAAASIALATSGAQAEEQHPAAGLDAAPLSSPVPTPRPDQLNRMLGKEVAAQIRAALGECLAEYQEIAVEVKADEGGAEEAAEVLELGEEDCGASQTERTQIALQDRQQDIARSAIDADISRQAELRGELTQLEARHAALKTETSDIAASTAELKIINDQLSDMLIAGAICEANGGTAEECGVDGEEMEDLFRRARELTMPSADRELVEVSEAVPKKRDQRVASLTDPDA